jgi:hypothetical protein
VNYLAFTETSRFVNRLNLIGKWASAKFAVILGKRGTAFPKTKTRKEGPNLRQQAWPKGWPGGGNHPAGISCNCTISSIHN